MRSSPSRPRAARPPPGVAGGSGSAAAWSRPRPPWSWRSCSSSARAASRRWATPWPSPSARRRATRPPSTRTNPKRVEKEVGGVWFPNYDYERDTGWKPIGSRTDDLDGRRAVTVAYKGAGGPVSYTIVDGAPLEVPKGVPWHDYARFRAAIRATTRASASSPGRRAVAPASSPARARTSTPCSRRQVRRRTAAVRCADDARRSPCHPRPRRELGRLARRGDWERFRTVWHDDGRMMATWFQGPDEEFIRVSREGFERGVRSCTSSAAHSSTWRATARSRRRR